MALPSSVVYVEALAKRGRLQVVDYYAGEVEP
jgi:hypothetical protein